MKKSFLYFILLLCPTVQGQNPIFEFHDHESIDLYLEENQLEYNESELFIFKEFEGFYNYSNEGYLRGPVVHVFDSNGVYLEYLKVSEVIDKLSNFKNIRKRPKKDALNIDGWISRLVNYKTLTPLIKEADKDYYFVLNWGIFFNKPHNIEALFKWNEVLQRQKLNGKNIQIIVLNMDLQESWGLSPEKQMDILKQANQ